MRQLVIIVALIFAHAAWGGDYKEGAAALGRGDYATALTKLLKAAEQGNRGAQYLTGLMYYDGMGVDKDYKEAVRWYQFAAQQGHAGAQSNLGYIYYKGQGVAQDYKEAVRWYRLAAQQGDRDAQNNLGVMYVEGHGVLQDNIKAHTWFNIAASNESKNSATNRDAVASKMSPQQIEQAQRMARECMASNFTKCD
jgi:TPR repeat protein